MPGKRVGIDFGTSNSGVAWYDGHEIHLLPIDQSNIAPEVVKSILYITRDYEPFIGQEAIRLYYKNNINRPRRFVKKKAGELDYYGADLFYVQDVYILVDELTPGRLLQYLKTGLRSDRYSGTFIFDRYYDLSSLIKTYLHELKRRTEAILGETIEGVTLGRPVQFHDDPEKDRKSEEILRNAAIEAGFNQVDFELEPVAAALFYETSLTSPENVLVFDFGGGTLDITIMRLGDPKGRRVYTSAGIGIAGADFDQAIIQKRMLGHLGKGLPENDPDLENLIDSVADWQVLPQLSTPQMKHRLEIAIAGSDAPPRLKALETLIFNDLAFQFYNLVEAAKMELSERGSTVISMKGDDIHIWELLTRLQFEHDIQEHRQRIEAFLQDTLNRSGLDVGEINTVIRTGGSSNVPCFIKMLTSLFGAGKVKASNSFSSVVSGLAIRAY
jgi:hypothetical chaperone protein